VHQLPLLYPFFNEYDNKAGSIDSLSGINVLVSIGDEFVAAVVGFVEVGRLSVTFVPEKLGTMSVLVNTREQHYATSH
jgi:hypothetical protein